ncbi:MAG: hypothetical protein JWR70_1830, partial [Modestobacter sp.]|nr:hypothetical protein [Modestobacter sp.]
MPTEFPPTFPPLPFAHRHIGIDDTAVATMLDTVGYPDLERLVDAAVPAAIRTARPLALP